MIDQNLLAKDGYNDLNLILDLVIVNRERAKYIGLALDVLDTIQVNVENQVNDGPRELCPPMSWLGESLTVQCDSPKVSILDQEPKHRPI